jgi:hypothetical protein
MSEKIQIMVDSGAHSIFMKMTERGQKTKKFKEKDDTWAYADSKEFWEYADRYGLYLQQNQDKFEVAVNLDVIRNPELTWRMQQYLENKYKVKILPVYHQGADPKWLKLYMDNYDYIGIGGLGQFVSRTQWIQYGDRTFTKICDDKGRPMWKTHGFAMTSPDLMLRYPWYSVDSTSWLVGEKFGLVIVPRSKLGKYDYSQAPLMVSMTTRVSSKKNSYPNISSLERNYILRYCKEVADAEYGESEFYIAPKGYKLQPGEFWAKKEINQVEKVIVPGIGNDMQTRNTLNIKYFEALGKYLEDNPVSFKPEFTGLGVI